MSIWYATNLSTLEGFANRQHKLEVSERIVPDGAEAFFEKLMKKSFGITGQLNKKTSTGYQIPPEEPMTTFIALTLFTSMTKTTRTRAFSPLW